MGDGLKRAVAAAKETRRNKNSDLLSDFVNYCVAHPHERFWQALRNWSGFKYIWVCNYDHPPVAGLVDTYYFEGKER